MKALINTAFLHIEVIGPPVQRGFCDLATANGGLILPSLWSTTIRPGDKITMHMWPMSGAPNPAKPIPIGIPPARPIRPLFHGARPTHFPLPPPPPPPALVLDPQPRKSSKSPPPVAVGESPVPRTPKTKHHPSRSSNR